MEKNLECGKVSLDFKQDFQGFFCLGQVGGAPNYSSRGSPLLWDWVGLCPDTVGRSTCNLADDISLIDEAGKVPSVPVVRNLTEAE